MKLRPLSRDEVRRLDEAAIEQLGLPGLLLMENAGRGVADLMERLGIAGPVVVCAGKGNNGGDGFVIARQLEGRGHEVHVLVFAAAETIAGDAAVNYRVLCKAGVPIQHFAADVAEPEIASALRGADWIVDALLGTGLRGGVRAPYAAAIAAINGARCRVLAVDLPSGLDADEGTPLGAAVRATHTATFVAPKRGFLAPAAGAYTGQVHVVDIGIPQRLLAPFAE